MADEEITYVLWLYTPSLAGAAVAAVIFAILSLLHSYSLIKTRRWFCIPIMIGGLLETIGYAARAAAHNDTETKTPYIIQSILILIGPVLFAASIYMVLGRIIHATRCEHLALIRVNWSTKVFVCGDILCFLMQSSGGGLLATAKTQDKVRLGENVILGGLVLQIIVFGFFVFSAAVFHRRLRRQTSLSVDSSTERFIFVLYAVSILIAGRNLARCDEYGLGRDGYLLRHEWCLYVYDCALMIITLSLCLVWYKLPVVPPRTVMDDEMALGDRHPPHPKFRR